MIKTCITGMTAVVLSLALAALGQAQHHHGGHSHGHHHHHGHVATHHGTHYGHHTWHHVVPHNHGHYYGAYYTMGNAHYYTPSPIVPIIQPFPIAGAPAVVQAPAVVHAEKPFELTFGGFARYEDLAARLAYEANLLCLDMHYNYRHNPKFNETYREAYDVLQHAKYISSKDNRGDRATLARRVADIDRQFHHIHDDTRAWTRVVSKPIGGDTLPQKSEAVEAVVHHLCYDLGVNPHQETTEAAPPPADTNEVAPPPTR